MFDLRPVAIVLGASTAMAQEAQTSKVDPAAYAVMERAAQAWDDVDTFVATVKASATGAIGAGFPDIEARIWFLRTDDGWYTRSFGQLTENDDVSQFDIAWTPGGNQWVDHDKQQVITGPRVKHRAAMVRRNIDLWLLGDEPIGGRLGAEQMTIAKPYTVGDVECESVLINQAGEKERWYIGKEDHLPRRIEMITMAGSMIYEFYDVDITRSLSPEGFVVDAPPGYTRVVPATPDPKADPRISRIDPKTVDVQTKSRNEDFAAGFALENPDGDTVSLEDLRGSIVLLDFWGTWCIPCRMASPQVQKIHEDYAERGVKVFGLAVRERSKDKPIEYFKEHEYTYGLLLDADKTAREYKVTRYPTFIVVDQTGRIVLTESGFDEETTFTNIRAKIDELLDLTGDGEPDEDKG